MHVTQRQCSRLELTENVVTQGDSVINLVRRALNSRLRWVRHLTLDSPIITLEYLHSLFLPIGT